MESSLGDITALLNKLAFGGQEAGAELVPMVYQELRRLAARCLRSERRDHTLQATALVHEAYLKLTAQRHAKWQNRAQFIGVASLLMRRILVVKKRARSPGRRTEKVVARSFDLAYQQEHFVKNVRILVARRRDEFAPRAGLKLQRVSGDSLDSLPSFRGHSSYTCTWRVRGTTVPLPTFQSRQLRSSSVTNCG